MTKEPFQKRIVVYGGSFNPPGRHHAAILRALTKTFDRVVIVPCGLRDDKLSTRFVSLDHRRELIEKAFAEFSDALIDWFDFEQNTFTPTHTMHTRYQALYPDAEVFHAIGEDLVVGGGKQCSEIQRSWVRGPEVWRELRFVVLQSPDLPISPEDLPPKSFLLSVNDLFGIRSRYIREHIAQGLSLDRLVVPEVEKLIREKKLYAGPRSS